MKFTKAGITFSEGFIRTVKEYWYMAIFLLVMYLCGWAADAVGLTTDCDCNPDSSEETYDFYQHNSQY